MYPANFFSLFPPFPRNDRVFVAMSFDPVFHSRWTNVIAPGIRDARHNGRQLEPYPVNARTISDSIITEILTGIADSRLVFADISTMAKDQDKAFRNGNVMYEVGIAHAVRLPEEVILFRSDRDALLFDTSDVRVNEYDPDADPDKARATVTGAVESALREIDLRRHLAVRKAVESLDAYTYCTCWP